MSLEGIFDKLLAASGKLKPQQVMQFLVMFLVVFGGGFACWMAYSERKNTLGAIQELRETSHDVRTKLAVIEQEQKNAAVRLGEVDRATRRRDDRIDKIWDTINKLDKKTDTRLGLHIEEAPMPRESGTP